MAAAIAIITSMAMLLMAKGSITLSLLSIAAEPTETAIMLHFPRIPRTTASMRRRTFCNYHIPPSHSRLEIPGTLAEMYSSMRN